MITRRDLAVASLASFVTLAGAAGVRVAAAPDVMGSTIFDWNDMTPTPNKYGEVRSVVRRPTATLDELEIHITTLNPGESSHAPHQHPNEELVIVRQGTVESLNNGQLKRVGPGSIIFQASNQLHSLKNVGTEPAIYHVVNWASPGMLQKK
jgi:XRE family transcriptional regulator, regulator of sulfur utilization